VEPRKVDHQRLLIMTKVYKSVSTFDEMFAEKKLWDDVNQWLSQRR